MTQTTKIAQTTYWDGEQHVPAWCCSFCGYSWPSAAELRDHLRLKHPSVVIVDESDRTRTSEMPANKRVKAPTRIELVFQT